MINLFPRITSVAVAALLSSFAMVAQATVINFQDYVAGTGTYFVGAGNAQTLTITAGGYDVVFGGGTPLGPNISNLPATASVAYGTADFANSSGQSGYTNPLTIQFFDAVTFAPSAVNNFFLNLYNGNTVPVDYTLMDNLGNGSVFNVGENFSSGQQTFGFASAGNSFTVTGGPALNGCCAWDFFINQIGFNEKLPEGSDNGHPISPVPEPSTYAMLLAGLGLIAFTIYRRRKNDSSTMPMAA
jgi:hypothetical protein